MKYKIRLIGGPRDGEELELKRGYSDPEYYPLILYFPIIPLSSILDLEESLDICPKPIRKHVYRAFSKDRYVYAGEK